MTIFQETGYYTATMIFNKEYTGVFSLAFIMAVRMLGLFMILPVFSIHSNEFAGATAALTGLALGVYGLTQAALQMPLAALSDRVGRKPIIAAGLCIFIIGSIVAALSHDIYWLIIGRALQGAGAVGSTVLAFAADLTREENRAKAMGVIGFAIGVSFAIAMVLGPALNALAGLAGIFWATAGLAALAGLILWAAAPKPPLWTPVLAERKPLFQILKDPQLLRLDASIFFLHTILTALFIAIPILLTRTLQLSAGAQIGLYLLVLILAFGLMLPPLIIAEKKRRMKPVFLGAVALLFLTQLFLGLFPARALGVSLALLLFFTAFSLLEAALPAWVSKITPARHKGAAMGFYSTAQFLGIFAGGSVGGWIFGRFGGEGVFIFGAVIAIIWFAAVIALKPPPVFSRVTFELDRFEEREDSAFAAQFYGIAGVIEVAIMRAENLIVFKIDEAMINPFQLRQALEKSKLADARFSQGGTAAT